MVVYHGTDKQFNTFKLSELRSRDGSFFFAQNREDADGYSSGAVIEAFVNIKNPFDYEKGAIPSEYKKKWKEADTKRKQVFILKDLGYDGWIADFENGNGYGEISAFYASQIKSATDNVGAFDSANDDIRFQKQSAEEQQIIDHAKTNGTYLKAPNGKTTKINEKQWAQVRTKAFKDWFGDWEKATRIEKLRNSKPIEITGEEITQNEDVKQYRRNALEYGKALRGEYVNKDTGEKIAISRASLTEVLSHSILDDGHIQSIAAIPLIIENSIHIDTVANEDLTVNEDVGSYDYYVCGLNIGGVDYTVKAVVANAGRGVRYYDHKLTQIEKGKLLSVSPVIHKSGSDNNLPNKSGYSNLYEYIR